MYYKSFSIFKNATGKDHAIYMQVFLSGRIFTSPPPGKKIRKKVKSKKHLSSSKALPHFCPECMFENVCIGQAFQKTMFHQDLHSCPLLLRVQLIHDGREPLSGFLPHGPLNFAHSKRISTGSCRQKKEKHFAEHVIGKVWRISPLSRHLLS